MAEEIYTKAIYIANDGEIEEFEDYEISNYGNVRSIKNGKVREKKLQNTYDGYLSVMLRKNNKRKPRQVHRLVLSSFMADQYFPGAQVDHIDSTRNNNQLENLRWVTPKENSNTDHRRNILSNINKGKKLSIEHKQKISNTKKGKTYSDEHKQKISEAMKGSNSPLAQSCIYDDKEFGCIKDAYRYAIENGLFNKCYDAFLKMIKHKK